MGEAHVNGVKLYHEEHGQGDPILCIHGTSSAMLWRLDVRRFSWQVGDRRQRSAA